MIILGLDFIESKPFYKIGEIEDISKTASNSTVIFDLNKQNYELAKYCKENSISFAVRVDSVKEILFANALEVSFIVCSKKLCQKAQKLADEYMFDAKVLLYSEDEADLEFAADLGIDGIIFKKGIR